MKASHVLLRAAKRIDALRTRRNAEFQGIYGCCAAIDQIDGGWVATPYFGLMAPMGRARPNYWWRPLPYINDHGEFTKIKRERVLALLFAAAMARDDGN